MVTECDEEHFCRSVRLCLDVYFITLFFYSLFKLKHSILLRKRGTVYIRCIFGAALLSLSAKVLTLICHPGELPVRKCPEAEVISVHAPILQAASYCSGLFFYKNREEAYPHAVYIIKDNMTGSKI